MQDVPEKFNYTCVEHCDTCGSKQEGIMHHSNDAMGMATPVFWQCSRCANPPFFINVYRKLKGLVLRKYLRVRYVMRTTKAQRLARVEKLAEARARMEARREAAK